MRFVHLWKRLVPVAAALAALYVVSSLLSASAENHSKVTSGPAGEACPNDDSGLKLPAGFCATIFADGIGHARHMVVAPNGVVYVNTWSGEYYGNDKPHDGGFLVALQDKAGAGKADVSERFGETVQSGGAGGTGIGLYKGSIYAEINDRIVRYPLAAGSIVPKDAAATIVSGFASRRRPSNASLHYQFRRRDVCGCGERHQFVPAEKSHTQIAGSGSMYGA